MKFSDIKTFKDLLASFFVLKFDPEDEPKPKRARKKSGQYKADDPSTPDINEAYVDGKAPAKKKPAAKKTAKKTAKK